METKNIYEHLKDTLTYTSHSEICGCAYPAHYKSWTIVLKEEDVREILSELLRLYNELKKEPA